MVEGAEACSWLAVHSWLVLNVYALFAVHIGRYEQEGFMSIEDHKKRIGIPQGHDLVETKATDWVVRKGQDTDTFFYDHIDENGIVVAKYMVKDSTSTYPPFGRSITWSTVT